MFYLNYSAYAKLCCWFTGFHVDFLSKVMLFPWIHIYVVIFFLFLLNTRISKILKEIVSTFAFSLQKKMAFISGRKNAIYQFDNGLWSAVSSPVIIGQVF